MGLSWDSPRISQTGKGIKEGGALPASNHQRKAGEKEIPRGGVGNCMNDGGFGG